MSNLWLILAVVVGANIGFFFGALARIGKDN